MFKRRTTVDPAEKQKRNKQIEIFNILDLCLRTFILK